MTLQSLNSLLKNRSSTSPLFRGIEAAAVVASANQILIEVVGKVIQDAAQAVSFRNQHLTIACLSSVVAQEVRLYEDVIIEKINGLFGKKIIGKIIYQT